jgi:hypothetical protein
VGQCRRVFPALSLLHSAFPALAAAQVTLGTGVLAATTDRPGRDRWRASQVMGSALRIDRPWLALATDGALLRDGRGEWRGVGSLEAAALATGPLGSRLALAASLGEAARDSMLSPSRLVVGARLSRRVGPWGGWLAVDAARPDARYSHTVADFISGAWRQVGSALVSVSLSSRAGAVRGSHYRTRTVALADSVVRDSLGGTPTGPGQPMSDDTAASVVAHRWSEAEGRLFWAGGRWSIDVAVRGRLGAAGVGAAMWATADGAWLLGPRVALIGGVGTGPAGPWSRLPARRHANIGVRLLRGAPITTPLPVELQPVAVAFEVQELSTGVYRVAVRVPRARVVEVTGDFTGWRPVALNRGSGDWWEASLPMTPGTHQINVRINGERWIAPPGATVVDDDFAGVVGVIVVR